ncbi:cytochrome P450 4V2 [Tetranychus urticae]|uniref:Cytochrome P450 n=1 Tax=Tetranychus urticae TaxID=32264 RepID=T1KXD9_TETUR|nr:cytochrome P450 4V2 [Tetranychus urticae]
MDHNIWISFPKAISLVGYLIIAYFIHITLLKPTLNLLHKIYHYHGLHCLPKNFLFGHLKLLSPNFPFPSNMEDISRNMYTWFEQTISTNKDRSLSVMWLGLFPVIIISDHAAVEAVMTKTNVKKPFFYKYIGLKNGLITSDPSLWKIRRKAIEPFFVTKRQKHFVKLMEQEIREIPEKLLNQIDKPIDMEHLIHTSTLRIIERVVGSIPLDDLKEEKEITLDLLTSIEQIAMKRAMNPLLWFDILINFFETGKSYLKNLERIETLMHSYMEHRKKVITLSPPKQPEEYDLVHLLEKHTDQTGTLEELVTSIAAGHETVSVSLRWTLFSLGNHPEIQERLYHEIIEHFPGDTPTDDFDKINACTYLDKFLKESLRLNPPVHFIGRVLDEDIKVNGTKIFKDTNIFICITSTHRDPSIYPDPDKFDPERWNPENSSKIPKSAFIPFGYGPRNCIGYRYAMMELKVYLIHILRKFSMKSTRTSESIPLKSEISLKPALPLEIILTTRHNINQEMKDL